MEYNTPLFRGTFPNKTKCLTMTKGLKNLLGYQERRAKAVHKRAPHLQQLAQALRSVPASPDPSAGCAGTVGSPPCTVSAQGSSSSLARGFRVSRTPDLTAVHLTVGSANRRGETSSWWWVLRASAALRSDTSHHPLPRQAVASPSLDTAKPTWMPSCAACAR